MLSLKNKDRGLAAANQYAFRPRASPYSGSARDRTSSVTWLTPMHYHVKRKARIGTLTLQERPVGFSIQHLDTDDPQAWIRYGRRYAR
jgi:hypothetical protein